MIDTCRTSSHLDRRLASFSDILAFRLDHFSAPINDFNFLSIFVHSFGFTFSNQVVMLTIIRAIVNLILITLLLLCIRDFQNVEDTFDTIDSLELLSHCLFRLS